jgi:hypothetical protein
VRRGSIHDDDRNRKIKIILHFNVREVYFRDVGCLIHLYVVVTRCWEDGVAGGRFFRITLCMWNADGGERLSYATIDPRVYELRFGPMSCGASPSTEGGGLARSKDLGLRVGLVSVGW